MAGYDKDEVPMLSDAHPQFSDDNVQLKLDKFMSRTRSASVSIPMSSMDSSYEGKPRLVGHTGPLRSQSKTLFVPMSGPLYAIANHRPDSIFRPVQAPTAGQEAVEPAGEKFPSTNATTENEWAGENHVGKNEHLLRSGQLGLCNDPYCTTCPTFNLKAAQAKHRRASDIFDPKVVLGEICEGPIRKGGLRFKVPIQGLPLCAFPIFQKSCSWR